MGDRVGGTEPGNPQQHHWLEDDADISVRLVIDRYAAEVWDRLRVKLNCLEASIVWHQAFHTDGVPSELHGRIGGTERGGYLNTTGGIDNHVWLVVGSGRALFDPTYTQLLDDPPWSLGRYIVENGQPFPEWRDAQNAIGPLQYVPPAPREKRFWER